MDVYGLLIQLTLTTQKPLVTLIRRLVYRKWFILTALARSEKGRSRLSVRTGRTRSVRVADPPGQVSPLRTLAGLILHTQAT